MFSLFTSRKFWPIFWTQFSGAWTDNFLKNVLLVLIVFTLGGTQGVFWVTMALGLLMLPFFLFSATAGILADHMDRAKLARILKAIEILLMLFAGYGIYTHCLPLLLVLLFLMGTQSAFFGPIKYALLPQHVSKFDLVKANAYVEAGTYIAILLGSILGAVLIQSRHGELLSASLLILMAIAGYLTSCYIPAAPTGNPQLPRWNIFSDTAKIVKKISSRKSIFKTILAISWFWTIGSLLIFLLVPFTQYVLNAYQTIFSYFLVLFSIGVGLGAILCKKLMLYKTKMTFVPLGLWVMTLSLCWFCFLSTSYCSSSEMIHLSVFLQSLQAIWLSLSLLGIAIGGGLFSIPLYVFLQTKTPLTQMAKTVSVNNILNSLCMVLGAIISGILTKLGLSVLQLFWILSAFSLVVTLFVQVQLPGNLCRSLGQILCRILFRVRVVNVENFLHSGKHVLIIANHASLLDGPLLGFFLPEPITFAITKEMSQRWWVKMILRFTDYCDVDPEKPFSIRTLAKQISAGHKCMIFPEGHMTYTGHVEAIQPGAACILQLASARVLPIHIEGSQYSKLTHIRKKVSAKWFPQITLRIYPSHKIQQTSFGFDRAEQKYITSQLQKILFDLEKDSASSANLSDYTR